MLHDSLRYNSNTNGYHPPLTTPWLMLLASKVIVAVPISSPKRVITLLRPQSRFGGQVGYNLFLSGLSPKRECGPRRVDSVCVHMLDASSTREHNAELFLAT